MHSLKIHRIVFLLLFICTGLAGQKTLNRNEKIYLVPSSQLLYPGDTCSVSGIVVDQQNLQPARYSKYVYLELFDSSDSIWIRQKLSCDEKGCFHTRIPIDVLSPFGLYYIRAYTRLMCNLPEWAFPTVPVEIGNKSSAYSFSYPSLHLVGHDSVRFYPEGGNLVAGCLQQTVFEIKDQNGIPLLSTGELIDEQDSVISSGIYSLENGLGSLRFIANKDQVYRLRLKRNDGTVSGDYPLPPADSEQPSVQLNFRNNKLYYSLLASPENGKSYRMLLFFRGIYLYEALLSHDNLAGIIDVSPYPSGIYSCLLMDQNEKVAERTLFVHGHEYEKCPVLLCDKEIYNPGEDLQLSLNTEDSLYCAGIRFIDLTDTLSSQLQSDIISELLFASDFATPVPYIRQSLFSADRNMKQQADWLMVTLRWNRFDLTDTTKTLRYEPEQLLTLHGRVETEMGFDLKKGSLVAMQTDNGFTYTADVLPHGRFVMGVDDFQEGSSYFIQAYNQKGKSYNLKVIPDADTFPGIDNRLKSFYRKRKQPITTTNVHATDTFTYYYDNQNLKNYRLPEIQVQARLKVKEPENKYFFTPSKITQEAIDQFSYPDLLPYFERMVGVKVEKTTNGYMIKSLRGMSLLAMGGDSIGGLRPDEIPILLDGTYVETDWVINTLDPKMVKSIERLSPGQALAYTSLGLNGVIMITTREYTAPKSEPKGIQYLPLGLSNLALPPPELPGKYKVPAFPGDYLISAQCISPSGIPYNLTKIIKVAE